MKALAFASVLALSLPATSASTASLDNELQQTVRRLGALATDGYAQLHPEQSALVRSESSSTIAVFFTLDGPAKGNGNWQFLAFFEPNTALTHDMQPTSWYRLLAFQRIGSRGSRFFDPKTASFNNGAVTVAGAEMGPGDAMCCPSVPVRAAFRLEGQVIVEQPAGS